MSFNLSLQWFYLKVIILTILLQTEYDLMLWFFFRGLLYPWSTRGDSLVQDFYQNCLSFFNSAIVKCYL